jgi:hypothetical protein
MVLELIGLVDKNGKIKGQDTDDLVLALSMVLYVIKYNLTEFSNKLNLPDEENEDFKNILRDNLENPILTDLRQLKNIQDPIEYNEYVQHLNENQSRILNRYDKDYDEFFIDFDDD